MICVSIARTARSRVLKFCGAAATSLLLAGCSYDLLDPKGPIGIQEKQLLLNATMVMLAVIIPVMILTVGFAWHYRAGNPHAKRDLEWDNSTSIEVVVWAIPILVILLLGGITWVSTHDLDPPKPLVSKVAPVEIDVVAMDWKWLFIYPAEGIASVNKVVLPVGTPVRFRTSASSVMNTFFIPRLGSMVYSMAGMVTDVNLQADEVGTYRGLSGNFSGDGFSDMVFDANVVSEQDYQQWLLTTRNAGGTLDTDAYAALMKPSEREPVRTWGVVSPSLFTAIVAHPGVAPTADELAHVAAMATMPMSPHMTTASTSAAVSP